MFKLQYEPLPVNQSLGSWEIAVIPWDTETFGFGVSALRPCGHVNTEMPADTGLKAALKTYAEAAQIRMVITSTPVACIQPSLSLQRAGFRMIDMAYQVRYDCFRELPEKGGPDLTLTPAAPATMDLLTEMAGTSFHHGRYHRDPCIPASLADRRYRDWIRRSFDPQNSQEVLAVLYKDSICGFSVVEHHGEEGYLHLHAIDSPWRGQGLGMHMIRQSLKYLSDNGAKTVDTRISASNLRALNMHSRLKARFIEADYLWHWHLKECE